MQRLTSTVNKMCLSTLISTSGRREKSDYFYAMMYLGMFSYFVHS